MRGFRGNNISSVRGIENKSRVANMGPGTTRNSSINSRGNNISQTRQTPKNGSNFIH